MTAASARIIAAVRRYKRLAECTTVARDGNQSLRELARRMPRSTTFSNEEENVTTMPLLLSSVICVIGSWVVRDAVWAAVWAYER